MPPRLFLVLVFRLLERVVIGRVALAAVLSAPLRLEAVGLDAPLNQSEPVLQHPLLGLVPARRRVRPQPLGQGGGPREDLALGRLAVNLIISN